MTAAERTNWSRRRAAAISFLANISLDGSNSDANFSLFTKRDRVVADSLGDYKVNVFDVIDAQLMKDRTAKSPKTLLTYERYPESIQMETVFEKATAAYNVGAKVPDLNKNSSMVTPFRERTNTIGSDHCTELRSSITYRKKLLHQTSLSDEKSHHHFSSTESIGSVIGRGKGIIETVGMKEVRFLKTKQFRSHRLKDERLILATGNKIPLAIFSHFPYDRNYKICSVSPVSSEELWRRNAMMKHMSIIPLKFWSSPSMFNMVSHGKIRG